MKDQRIDMALSEMIPDYSRSKITAWIKSGEALINNKTFKPKDKVNGNETVCLKLNQKNNIHWLPEKINLDIVFEDDDIIVINKPFGLVTHPGAGNWSGTLANALLHHDPHLSSLDRAGIVHRLDKNTSGLMVVSKNLKSQKFLVEQLQNHSVEREYSAIVYGHMISGGSINEPIGRDPKDRVKQAILINGKEAITHFKVLERFGYVTLIECQLETGRTHQIRAHLKFIGHTLFNDARYGGDLILKGTTFTKYKQFIDNCFKILPRQALHAKTLGFIHPTTGEMMRFDTELPQDMQDCIEKWRNYSKSHEVMEEE